MDWARSEAGPPTWQTETLTRRSEHVVSAVAHREVEKHLDVSRCHNTIGNWLLLYCWTPMKAPNCCHQGYVTHATTSAHTYTNLHAPMYARAHVHMHGCMYAHTHARTHTHKQHTIWQTEEKSRTTWFRAFPSPFKNLFQCILEVFLLKSSHVQIIGALPILIWDLWTLLKLFHIFDSKC